MQCLQVCLDITDWNMFIEACDENLDELADVTCSYVTFCRNTILPEKRVRIFPNNRPWVTKSVISTLQAKRCAFCSAQSYKAAKN